MPNQKIFCNSPWYELHIYWDGGLGFCCQGSHRLYPDSQQNIFNVHNMSISKWVDSQPMRDIRMAMHDDHPIEFCSRCQHEEKTSGTSRRHRSNQKSVIFTRGNFLESYQQSPGYDKFEHSLNTQGECMDMPIDLHIDLGNYCNLTCKMCDPAASSAIASQYVKWNIESARQYVGTDWTRNTETWNRVLNEIASIKNLRNVHFMGGETLITKRFTEFVDFMISQNRLDLNFSFVTNGTTFDESLINKLKKFNRVGIEVSIETLTVHNEYQRQGTNTGTVLQNLEKYFKHCDNVNITVALRPAVSALTIGTYYTLLKYALDKQLVVRELVVTHPQFLDPSVLPDNVKQEYISRYQTFRNNLTDIDRLRDFNESHPHEYQSIVLNQVDRCINLLQAPAPANADKLMSQLVEHCRRWDSVHQYNALELYPELAEEFIKHGY